MITKPLRAFALWLGKPIIVMMSVGNSVRMVGVRDYSSIDNALPSPEYFLQSAKSQDIEVDEIERSTWFRAWTADPTEDDLGPDMPVERETYEYVARVTATDGPALHRWRLRELPASDRADLQTMLSHRDTVLAAARDVCVGLGGMLYLVKHDNPKALPVAEWEIEPAIACRVD